MAKPQKQQQPQQTAEDRARNALRNTYGDAATEPAKSGKPKLRVVEAPAMSYLEKAALTDPKAAARLAQHAEEARIEAAKPRQYGPLTADAAAMIFEFRQAHRAAGGAFTEAPEGGDYSTIFKWHAASRPIPIEAEAEIATPRL